MNGQLYEKIATIVSVAIACKNDPKTVMGATDDIFRAIQSELPPEIDVQGKWELQPGQQTVHVTLKGCDAHDGIQLTHLSKFAADEGYNEAIHEIQRSLSLPEKSDIVEEPITLRSNDG